VALRCFRGIGLTGAPHVMATHLQPVLAGDRVLWAREARAGAPPPAGPILTVVVRVLPPRDPVVCCVEVPDDVGDADAEGAGAGGAGVATAWVWVDQVAPATTRDHEALYVTQLRDLSSFGRWNSSVCAARLARVALTTFHARCCPSPTQPR
jgi:hypothetical protein